MKNTRKFLAILLALSFVVSMFSFNVFADDAIESPIIPVGPGNEGWYEYELNAEKQTAVLTALAKTTATKITVRSTYTKDNVTYSVVAVGENAFNGTNIQSVKFEEGVQTIAAGAFANCASLKDVTFADSITEVASSAFEGSLWLKNQPDGIVYAGKVAYKVKGVSDAVVVLAGDTASVSADAFKDQTTLEKIYIPQNTTIGEGAFAGCTAVTFYCYEDSPAATYAAANGINVVTIPALSLKAAPTKIEYYQNDELNFAGLELVYISEEGENFVEVTPDMVSGYDSATIGVQTVTITYCGFNVSFDVTVIERPPFIPGDVDGNDIVELNDAIYLLYYFNCPGD